MVYESAVVVQIYQESSRNVFEESKFKVIKWLISKICKKTCKNSESMWRHGRKYTWYPAEK